MNKGGRSYRFNMRVSPAWMERVRAEAERLGISMADWVIMTVNEKLQAGEAKRPAKPTRKK
jgi:predicted HicB family RNase H-like nuclease